MHQYFPNVFTFNLLTYGILCNKRKVKNMSEPIELTNITIIQEDTPNKIRKAYIGNFEEPI